MENLRKTLYIMELVDAGKIEEAVRVFRELESQLDVAVDIVQTLSHNVTTAINILDDAGIDIS